MSEPEQNRESSEVKQTIEEEGLNQENTNEENLNNSAVPEETGEEQAAQVEEENEKVEENEQQATELETEQNQEETADPVSQEGEDKTDKTLDEDSPKDDSEKSAIVAQEADEDNQETSETAQAEEETVERPEETEGVKRPEEESKEQAQDVAQEESSKTKETAEESPQSENVGTGTEAAESGAQEPEVDPHAETPEPRIDKDATATVRFVLMPSGQVATLRCNLSQTLQELREHFATELKMEANVILLMYDGKNMDSGLTLLELGVGPNGTIQLEMQSSDPINAPIKAIRPRQEYHMPDVITVRVVADECTESDVVVEIERTTRKKPFLGGYRHKKTGTEYHHASAQTMQKQKPVSAVERFSRDTQTVQQKHRVQQTHNDTSTQMTKIGVYVSNIEDKLVVPGKYTTAEEYHRNVYTKVIVLQKYYRRWLAKRYVEKVRCDKQARLEWERQEEIRKRKEKEDRIRQEFERRMNPKNTEDFDLLYHALEKWRMEEEEQINSADYSEAERKAALCQLLDQETQLIASIGRHKLEADTENKQKKIQAFLDKAAAPKKWRGPDGKHTEMDTPYTLRAQELKDIYNSINMKYLTQDERLDVLLTLKHTVKEHDCKLTAEIIELIDREADLLMRGVKEGNLDGLRKRISTLFLQYIKTPTFNPEAARLLKVPQDPSTLRKDIYFCSSCNQYLPSTEFQLSSNARVVGKCRKCKKIDNDGRTRQDYSHYRYMLKNLQRSEQEYGDNSTIAFLLQENDLRYLVENVWNSQSALSAWDDLYDMVLVRWDREEEWSPWNCILLTKEEASAHNKMSDLVEGYGRSFIHKVQHKHTLAKNYFSRLPGMVEQMRSRAEHSAQRRGPSITGKAMPMQTMKA